MKNYLHLLHRISYINHDIKCFTLNFTSKKKTGTSLLYSINGTGIQRNNLCVSCYNYIVNA